MNFAYEGKRNCFTMDYSQDGYVKEWVDSETTDQVVKIAPYPHLPYAFFNELNNTHYEWCGTSLLIAKSFAKLTKSK